LYYVEGVGVGEGDYFMTGLTHIKAKAKKFKDEERALYIEMFEMPVILPPNSVLFIEGGKNET